MQNYAMAVALAQAGFGRAKQFIRNEEAREQRHEAKVRAKRELPELKKALTFQRRDIEKSERDFDRVKKLYAQGKVTSADMNEAWLRRKAAIEEMCRTEARIDGILQEFPYLGNLA